MYSYKVQKAIVKARDLLVQIENRQVSRQVIVNIDSKQQLRNIANIARLIDNYIQNIGQLYRYYIGILDQVRLIITRFSFSITQLCKISASTSKQSRQLLVIYNKYRVGSLL